MLVNIIIILLLIWAVYTIIKQIKSPKKEGCDKCGKK